MVVRSRGKWCSHTDMTPTMTEGQEKKLLSAMESLVGTEYDHDVPANQEHAAEVASAFASDAGVPASTDDDGPMGGASAEVATPQAAAVPVDVVVALAGKGGGGKKVGKPKVTSKAKA